jgi:hypothetical protein
MEHQWLVTNVARCSSEGSSSPVPRPDTMINRPLDSLNETNVTNYRPVTVDSTTSDNLEHYHSHANDDV